jgi:hypothetical protein
MKLGFNLLSGHLPCTIVGVYNTNSYFDPLHDVQMKWGVKSFGKNLQKFLVQTSKYLAQKHMGVSSAAMCIRQNVFWLICSTFTQFFNICMLANTVYILSGLYEKWCDTLIFNSIWYAMPYSSFLCTFTIPWFNDLGLLYCTSVDRFNNFCKLCKATLIKIEKL